MSAGLSNIRFRYPAQAWTREEICQRRPLTPGEQDSLWPYGFLYLPRYASIDELLLQCGEEIRAIRDEVPPDSRVLCIACLNEVACGENYQHFGKLLANDCAGWDVATLDTTCYGWAFFMNSAQQLIEQDEYDVVVVLAATTQGMQINPEVGLWFVNYCDALCVMQFDRNARYRVRAFASLTDSRFGNMNFETSHKRKMLLQKELVSAEWQNFSSTINRVLHDAGVSADQVDGIMIPFITPDSEKKLFSGLGGDLKEKHVIPELQAMGLIAGVGCLREFHESHEHKRWQAGDLLILCGMGYAYTWTTLLLETLPGGTHTPVRSLAHALTA